VHGGPVTRADLYYGRCRGGNNQPSHQATPLEVKKTRNTITNHFFRGPFFRPIYHIGSVRTRVVQHPRVVRRLLPGSCAGTARPRRFLPGRWAGTVGRNRPTEAVPARPSGRNRPADLQEPLGRPAGTDRPPAVPAVPAREPPPGAARPGGRCGRNRSAPAGHDGVPKSRIVSFPYHIISSLQTRRTTRREQVARLSKTGRWALALRPEHHPRSDQSGHVEQPACRTRCPKEPHAQRSWHLQWSLPAQSEDLRRRISANRSVVGRVSPTVRYDDQPA